MGIFHEFFSPKTPQENGVVERNNRTLHEMARVMLCAKGVETRFWAKAVNTACYIYVVDIVNVTNVVDLAGGQSTNRSFDDSTHARLYKKGSSLWIQRASNTTMALLHEFWNNAMQDEMGQFKRNKVWILVPKLDELNIIGTEWLFKNKSDEFGTMVRNKARLMAHGYNQVERVDFEETFVSIAQLESIR
uniref:Integrase catalytic domain-containing protein n=1 Tax=Cannabis sativa TaxID=3483 RepID=A0A803NUB7_CANSA